MKVLLVTGKTAQSYFWKAKLFVFVKPKIRSKVLMAGRGKYFTVDLL